MRFYVLAAFLLVTLPAFGQNSGTVGYSRSALGMTPTNLTVVANSVRAKITNASIYSVTGILKGDGAGGMAEATAGVDYAIPGGAVTTGQLPSGATLDTEWDTIGEIETATSVNIIVATEIDTQSEFEALLFALPSGGGGSVFVNGAEVTGINLTNSTYIVFNTDGTNVTAYPTNLTAAQLSPGTLIWTNDNGAIKPSWTAGSQLGISYTPDSESLRGQNVGVNGLIGLAIFDVASGDTNQLHIYYAASHDFSDPNSHYSGFAIDVLTNRSSLSMAYDANGTGPAISLVADSADGSTLSLLDLNNTTRTLLFPSVPDTGAPAYAFDSEFPLTSSPIAQFFNSGDSYYKLGSDGGLTLEGGSAPYLFVDSGTDNLFVDTTTLEIQIGGSARLSLLPNAGGTFTAYKFDTVNEHTAGNLAEFKEVGNIRSAIDHTGAFTGNAATATLATTATTANAGDSADDFFSSGTIAIARLPSELLTSTEGDAAYVPLARTITAGVGLSGGGDLSANRTLTWAPETRVDNVTVFDGTQASRTWTFSLSGASDPVITFANNSFTINNAGLTVANGSTTISAGGVFMWTGRSRILSTSDGVISFFNNAQSANATTISGIAEFAQVASGGTPASNSGRVYAKDGGGTAEIYAMDEAGNESLQTPHPDDAPNAMEDRADQLQDEFAKNVNYYVGKVEWINLTRLARTMQDIVSNTNTLIALGLTNRAALPAIRRRVYLVEDFATYNNRLGVTGTTNALIQLDWQTVQNQKQEAYDSERAIELAVFEAGNTNVIVRPEADIRKPKPAWMP